LRPILMTSLALIAGMIPVAIGLNEASKSRTSLGIVVIGGTISSTVLTLVVIPAAHIFIDRFQVWFLEKYRRVFGHDVSTI
jgi:hydrophobic/amphiphilic exporter-1 (mainly G- bacteria), HAE1 family